VRAFLSIALLLLAFAAAEGSDLMLRVGGGVLRVPGNDGLEAVIGPDGETVGSPHIALRDYTPHGWSVEFDVSGYRLETLSGGLKWTVPIYSLLFVRNVPLGDSLSSIGAVGGVSFLLAKLEADSTAGDIRKEEKSVASVGPLFGLELNLSLTPRIFGFLTASMVLAKSDLPSKVFREPEFDSVNIGPSGVYGGLAYRF